MEQCREKRSMHMFGMGGDALLLLELWNMHVIPPDQILMMAWDSD
jgi:hypothetical protein